MSAAVMATYIVAQAMIVTGFAGAVLDDAPRTRVRR